jgi:hypothetical protein
LQKHSSGSVTEVFPLCDPFKSFLSPLLLSSGRQGPENQLMSVVNAWLSPLPESAMVITIAAESGMTTRIMQRRELI